MVAGQPLPASKPLPLTHVTDCIYLPSILSSASLRPHHCPAFGDDRLYAFYARPAYRGRKKGKLTNRNFAPVGFIISPSITSHCTPAEVIPFDTGAMAKGWLDDIIHPALTPYDFSLEPSIDSARRVALMFFGSERDYFKADARRTAPLPQTRVTDAEIVAYESLVATGGNQDCDERATSIEVHFKEEVPITGNVLAVILPQEFLDDAEIRDALNRCTITPLAYEFMPQHGVKECAGVFYEAAAQFYSTHKMQYGWDW